MKTMENPFSQATEKNVKAKILLWGSYGTGKTTLALQFPNPVLIDLERGADLYASKYKFGVFATNDVNKIFQAVDWLRHNKHEYETVILDSMTEYWSALQEKWKNIFLVRNSKGVGNKIDFYDLQPSDWGEIKGEFKELLRNLIALNMHVVVTAREKELYSDEKGKFMKKIGMTFDCERNLPYMFDTVLHLSKNGSNYLAMKEKDRTSRLPENFAASFDVIGKSFGINGHSNGNGAHPPASVTAGMQETKPNGNAMQLSDEQVEANLMTDLTWYRTEKLGTRRSSGGTWQELAIGTKNALKEDLVSLLPGRAYLHQLENGKDLPQEKRLKAKIALVEGAKEQEQAELSEKPF